MTMRPQPGGEAGAAGAGGVAGPGGGGGGGTLLFQQLFTQLPGAQYAAEQPQKNALEQQKVPSGVPAHGSPWPTAVHDLLAAQGPK